METVDLSYDGLGTTRLCRNCFFWDAKAVNNKKPGRRGVCRIKPPHAKHGQPVTLDAAWCSRHSKRAVPLPDIRDEA